MIRDKRSFIGAIISAGLILLVLAPGAAFAQTSVPEEATVPSAPLPPEAAAQDPVPPGPEAAPLPDPPSITGLTADLETTIIDRFGHSTMNTVRIWKTGRMVRYEHLETNPPEVSVKDFEKMKDYRIYAADRIYFETDIPIRVKMKAERDGLIPREDRELVEVHRIPLREDELEGHPCEIVLQIRWIKDQKERGYEYTLLWESRNLNGQPLRVAYFMDNFVLTRIDFRNPRMESIDPGMITPPADYLSMTPF